MIGIILGLIVGGWIVFITITALSQWVDSINDFNELMDYCNELSDEVEELRELMKKKSNKR